MQTLFRLLLPLSIFVIAAGNGLLGQDIAVRVEAERLVERANGVSHPVHALYVQSEVRFRTYAPDGSARDGRFDTIHAGDIERYEMVLGDYHRVAIHYPDRIVQDGDESEPPEFTEVGRLTPLLIGRFDMSDTVHSIIPATISGRAAKCVRFETVVGRTHQSNEICVDDELGVLLRWNVGEDLIEDSEYSSFEGVLLPTRIRHYIDGKLRMEIEQKFTVMEDPIDWAALTPPNAVTVRSCHPYHAPVRESTPQPASAGPGPWYDVTVEAAIGPDGHVYQAKVLPRGRADLESQAIQIVSGWIFKPGLCSGRPTTVSADLVVHFPPQ
jgi:Gram-negative bacterial TonB protein C-terminal